MSENIKEGQNKEEDLTPKGLLRKALELYASDEKSAADREAKLQVLRLIASLRSGQTDDFVRGYREGYTDGFRDGYAFVFGKVSDILNMLTGGKD